MRRAITARRGQIAIEYISIYAFALIGLLVTLGVINYFGFFNGASLRSQSCVFPQGMECTDFIIASATHPTLGVDNYLRMNMTNEYGVNIIVTTVQMTSTFFTNVQTCTLVPPGVPPGNWSNGNSAMIWCPLPAGMYFSNEFYDGAVRVNFTQVGGGFEHSIAGRFSVKAQ